MRRVHHIRDGTYNDPKLVYQYIN